jgi:tetratricopeptide (TPR) repeat protein
MSEILNDLLRKGESALQEDDTLVALLQFERAYAIEPLPGVKSRLAYCMAKERHQYQQAMALCQQALQEEPDNPDHYYQLSRIYVTAGKKGRAIKSLRKGLKFKRHQPSIDALNQLGFRKTPPFSSLPREHILNRIAGILLDQLGSR